MFDLYVPKKSIKLLRCWVDDLNLIIKVLNPRKNKLGDFKVRNNQLIITINNNLNKYAFLITLVHEIAHAFVYRKYNISVMPHGEIWKLTYKSLMLNFLNTNCFPEEILKILSKHMINPNASSCTDLSLVNVLRNYDLVKSLILSELSLGDTFAISSGKYFIKGEKVRKRFKCIESMTNKVYLFHPFAEIIKI